MPAYDASLLIDPQLLERYLYLLGIRRRPPGLEALTELVTAQVTHVPFENISKTYYRIKWGLESIPSLAQYLDGIERYHFGGTCYSNNYYFYRLLLTLGYQVHLCGADMSNPNVHMVSMLDLEGRQYMMDVGYAAPFLTPLPRDLDTEQTIILGHDRYVLKPQDMDGCTRLDLFREGKPTHGYLARPIPRKIEDFSQVIADSFKPEATFMNALLLARFYPRSSLVIHNLTVIQSHGAEVEFRQLEDRQTLAREIEAHFNMPCDVVQEALDELGSLSLSAY